jgi:hypothetical protein
MRQPGKCTDLKESPSFLFYQLQRILFLHVYLFQGRKLEVGGPGSTTELDGEAPTRLPEF